MRRSNTSVLVAGLRIRSKTPFATVKSPNDSSNSSNTVELLFFSIQCFLNEQNQIFLLFLKNADDVLANRLPMKSNVNSGNDDIIHLIKSSYSIHSIWHYITQPVQYPFHMVTNSNSRKPEVKRRLNLFQ